MNIFSTTTTIIDLSENPSTALVTKLKKGDKVLYDGNEVTISVAPKKIRRDIWLVGVRDKLGSPDYIRIMDVEKQKMTSHEKKVMLINIESIVTENADNESFLLELVHRYYENLAEFNRYTEEDVRECMTLFPNNILVKSGIAL
jgi:hypothetical protein